MDYGWVRDSWLGEAYCLTFVRGLEEREVLRRFGGDLATLEPRTLEEVDDRQQSLYGGYAAVLSVARVSEWAVAVEMNGFQGIRPEVIRALSARTTAVSVFRSVNMDSTLAYAVDGELLTYFQDMVSGPEGSRPDALVPHLRDIGLDPGMSPSDVDARTDELALALVDRLTGVHLTPDALVGALPSADFVPFLEEPYPLEWEHLALPDSELALAVQRACPAQQRAAAVSEARRQAELAGVAPEPLVAQALSAAERGEPSAVTNESPLGRMIRRWNVEARTAEYQQIGDERADPGPARAAAATYLAGRTVQAAVLADPRHAAEEVLRQVAWPVLMPPERRDELLRMLRG